MNDRPNGSAALWASWRQGLNELGAAIAKPLPDSIQVDQPGTFGHPIPSQLSQEQQGELSLWQQKQIELTNKLEGLETQPERDVSR